MKYLVIIGTILSLLLSIATARRLPTSSRSEPPVDMKKMGKHGWGYPYGWGLDMPLCEYSDNEEEPNHHKTVKEVKTVKKINKKGSEEPVNNNGDHAHHHHHHHDRPWKSLHYPDISEIMDFGGLE